MTQIESAKQGILTPQMERVADQECLSKDKLLELVSTGRVVIPANRNHRDLEAIGIGKSLRTKINANIGTSCDLADINGEVKKLRMAVTCGADTVMDLSTGGDIRQIRLSLLSQCRIPFGNVPVYQMAVAAASRPNGFSAFKVEEMLAEIGRQAEDGVDFMTIHAGLTQRAIKKLQQQPRKAGIVSRGGALLTRWMLHHKRENPFYELFDDILEIARKYDVTLSLGDGLRPGSLADGSDWAQIEELMTLGELVQRSRSAGVQVMVEGPGHLPLNQIEMNVRMQKAICQEAPFYVLGPVVTDVAPGYDHLTSAIGGALAGSYGADFLCYVTPAEHLGLPDEEDVREGIFAARIAAHVADIAKSVPGAIEWDHQMAEARSRLDWQRQEELSLNPDSFRRLRAKKKSQSDACSMCGELCVYKILAEFHS